MRYSRWFFCLVVGHRLIGPRELRDLEDTVTFYGWHCSRCLIRVVAGNPGARLPKRSGFAAVLRAIPYETRYMLDRLRYAVLRLKS